jgi:hypothetical protein
MDASSIPPGPEGRRIADIRTYRDKVRYVRNHEILNG